MRVAHLFPSVSATARKKGTEKEKRLLCPLPPLPLAHLYLLSTWSDSSCFSGDGFVLLRRKKRGEKGKGRGGRNKEEGGEGSKQKVGTRERGGGRGRARNYKEGRREGEDDSFLGLEQPGVRGKLFCLFSENGGWRSFSRLATFGGRRRSFHPPQAPPPPPCRATVPAPGH